MKDTTKKFSVKTFILSMLIVNIISSLVLVNQADAKKAAFKKYTNYISVSVKNGKAKSVNLSKKLKKGDKLITKKKVTKDGIITIKKTSAKKVKVSVSGAKSNKTVAVKFRTKKNGTITIWVKITGKVNDGDNKKANKSKKTAVKDEDCEYFQKIVAELKSQLADPDKALLENYNKTFKDGVPTQLKEYYILGLYLQSHSSYDEDRAAIPYKKRTYVYYETTDKNEVWKKFYEGTFKGVCGDGALLGCKIARAVGFNARQVNCPGFDHAWLVIEMTDNAGVTYWQGVYVNSNAYSLSFDQSMTHNDEYDLYEYEYTIYGVTHSDQLKKYSPVW